MQKKDVIKPVEVTKAHKEAVADLVIRKITQTKSIDVVIGAVSVLFDSRSEADVFSLAMQKAGLKCPIMAGSIANKICNKKDNTINFISLSEDEKK